VRGVVFLRSGSLLDPHIVLQLPEKDATNDVIIIITIIVITLCNSFSLTMIFSPFLTPTGFSHPSNNRRDLFCVPLCNSLTNSHLDSSVNVVCLLTRMSLGELSEIWLDETLSI